MAQSAFQSVGESHVLSMVPCHHQDGGAPGIFLSQLCGHRLGALDTAGVLLIPGDVAVEHSEQQQDQHHAVVRQDS